MKNATVAAFAVGLLCLPGTAAACGSCAFGIADYALPHIFGWCLGITVWFFLLLTAVGPPALNLNPCIAIALVVLAPILGLAFVGPFPFYLLGLISLVATGKGFSPNVWPKLARSSQIGLKIVSALAVVCALAGLAISMHTKKNRSDVEFILKWSSTYQGNLLLDRLTSKVAANQAALREIRDKTRDKYLAQRVSEALAIINQDKTEQEADGK